LAVTFVTHPGFGGADTLKTMGHRATRRRYSAWEHITVHPRADRAKITALKDDMVRAFVAGNLDTYWKLDRELRWLLQQGKKRAKD
jgi:hypothetical protein